MRAFSALGLAMLPALSGCYFNISGLSDDDGHYSHRSVAAQERAARAFIATLPLGASTQTVIDQLGVPDFTELVGTGDHSLRVLRYRTHRLHADGDTTVDETTPLLFHNDSLIGSGEAALRQALGRE